MKAVGVILSVQPLWLVCLILSMNFEVLQVVMNIYDLYSKYFYLLFDPSDMPGWHYWWAHAQ